MATSSTTASFSCPVRGDSGGPADVLIQWTITSPLAYRQSTSIATVFTLITVPSGTSLAIIIPPTTNTDTFTLGGAGADTGISIAKTTPTILGLASGVTQFYLKFSSNVQSVEVVTI